MTPEEVADILRLSVRTITGSLCRKTLPWTKVGGALRMRKEDLLEFTRANHGSVLEERQTELGIRVQMAQEKIQKVRLSDQKSRPRRGKRGPRIIEEWEIAAHEPNLP